MTDQHPITPPRALLNQWMTEGWHQDYCSNIEFVAARSAHWSADQQLEQCIAWLNDTDCDDPQQIAQRLREAMRPTTQENN